MPSLSGFRVSAVIFDCTTEARKPQRQAPAAVATPSGKAEEAEADRAERQYRDRSIEFLSDWD